MDYDDICIICLDNISQNDAIWSCSTCWCEYHLVCINDWISQYRHCKHKVLSDEQESLNLSEGYTSALSRLSRLINDVDRWSCPKCRNEYSNEEAPNEYRCYCGKAKNPKTNHWLQPHSCGEKCGKFLKPYCGDVCMELCHRGACPPCPKMVNNVNCFCGKQTQAAVRCSQRYWSCGDICGKPLSCQIHFCGETCHGNCGECQITVEKKCQCGEQLKLVKCSESWQCSKSCKVVDKSSLNKCPCGKVDILSLNAGDTNRQVTCKDTCDKLLDCGQHRCSDRCHIGDCSNCRQMVSKSCRCGAVAAMMPCHKKFTCNTKCVRWKTCGKHQCRRRCCDPNLGCSPCELVCNNMLNCRKHRCPLRCHLGPCYPCQKTIDVSCSCGSTIKRVACGVKVDKILNHLTYYCQNVCPIPSKCHHENSHKCHSKDVNCPPCKELCTNELTCGHKCQDICHDYVKTVIRLDKSKLAGPWEAAEDGKIKYVCQPCSPCKVRMSLICFGGHELISYLCSQPIKFASCGRACGRLLACENHYCSLECHPTSDNKCPDKLLGDDVKVISASRFCEESCNKICSKPLIKNPCEHQCSKIICHKGPCPPCTRYVTHKCHCGALDLHIECNLGPNPPPEMLSCPSRCPRLLSKSCGHQCPRNCHAGDCYISNIQCKSKVVKVCPCGQKKMSIPCWKTGNFEMQCDPVKCDTIKSSVGDVRKRKPAPIAYEANNNHPTDRRLFFISRTSFIIASLIIISIVVLIINCVYGFL